MDIEYFGKQLDNIINDFGHLKNKSKYDDLSDLPETDIQALATKAIAAINRIGGNYSTYAVEVERVINKHEYLHKYINLIMGVLAALRDDLKEGYVQSLIELIHGEVFGDFLEMAEHLCDLAYKDAAAVIAGSSLESYLRSLCQKANIDTQVTKSDGKISYKKADTINSELASSAIYSKLDQKNVTAWLDLRNKAAHGKYDDYTLEQVKLLISGIRDFITRNPA